jgi:hypothetical protein
VISPHAPAQVLLFVSTMGNDHQTLVPPGSKHQVSLSRLSDHNCIREYCGVLISPLEVGSKMVVLVGESRRLITSAIQKIHAASGRVFIETAGSTYVLQFLGRAAPAYNSVPFAAA